MTATITHPSAAGRLWTCPACAALNLDQERTCHDCDEPKPAQVERAAEREEPAA